MDRKWREAISALDSHQDVLSAIEQPSLAADNLAQLEKELEQIQQGLDTLLETKRLQFPRFYFLSNEEIFGVLSQAENPLGLQEVRKAGRGERVSWLPNGA
jgi:dynein heavy chain, axonemal